MTWVYNEGKYLYTVGFYDPAGNWEPESDHDSKEGAAKRVHYLNGGNDVELLKAAIKCNREFDDPTDAITAFKELDEAIKKSYNSLNIK